MTIAVLCDFDDTITMQNVAHLSLERFGDGSWREVRRRYLDGLASAEDYFEKQFAKLQDLVQTSPHPVQRGTATIDLIVAQRSSGKSVHPTHDPVAQRSSARLAFGPPLCLRATPS